MNRVLLWTSFAPALLGACGADAPPASPPAFATYDFDRVGLSLRTPATWKVVQGTNDILIDIEAGKTLIGRLSWTTGGIPLDAASNNVTAGLTAKFGKVTVLKRATTPLGDLRLDLQVAIPQPVPQRMALVLFHHRGRIFNLTLSSLEPEWTEHAGDVDAFLQSIVRKPGQPLPAKSSSHSFEFELPDGWTFEPVEPPEGPIVARFWALGGFPCGQIMSLRHDGHPQPLLDLYLEKAPADWALKVIDRSANEAVFAHTLGTQRYQAVAKVLQGPVDTQWFQIWTTIDDFPARKAEFDRAVRTYKYYPAR